MRLFILAGGFGTRLKSISGHLPKALVPIAGKPFLHLQINHWKMQGVTSFIFLLHYQSELIVDFLLNENICKFFAKFLAG